MMFTLEPNLNTIVDGIAVIGIGYVAKILRDMNGTLVALVQWRTDHHEAHEEQRRLCDIRHGGLVTGEQREASRALQRE